MIWVRRLDAAIIWLAAAAYLIFGIGQIFLGSVDGHWLLYSGIACLIPGIAALYASTAAARGERFKLVLAGNFLSLLILPPLGLIGLVLCVWLRRQPQCAASQSAISP